MLPDEVHVQKKEVSHPRLYAAGVAAPMGRFDEDLNGLDMRRLSIEDVGMRIAADDQAEFRIRRPLVGQRVYKDSIDVRGDSVSSRTLKNLHLRHSRHH